MICAMMCLLGPDNSFVVDVFIIHDGMVIGHDTMYDGMIMTREELYKAMTDASSLITCIHKSSDTESMTVLMMIMSHAASSIP